MLSKYSLPACLYLLANVGFLSVQADPVLKQVHVISRHGARTALNKDGNTLSETAGSTLTPIGQKQLYELGLWLRQTYNIDGFLEYYDPSEVRLESSDTDRTLTSANSLSLGLFPYNAQAAGHGAELFESLLPQMPSIPVYSITAKNDIYQRAYHRNCPTFHDKLDTLFESAEWVELENSYSSLLADIADLFPTEQENDINGEKFKGGKIALKHLWNFYDQINVARTECLTDSSAYACVSQGVQGIKLANAVSDLQFQSLETLMGESEAIKFGVDMAGSLLGSRLLWKLLDRINDSDDAKFFLYSAHAPTLMGFMSTLQEWQDLEALPGYASAIIMEVYKDTDASQHTIRFLYKPSDRSKAYYINPKQADCSTLQPIDSVPTATADLLSPALVTHCELSKFLEWAVDHTFVSDLDWCEACQNEEADVCLRESINDLVEKHNNVIQEMEDQLFEDGAQPVVVGGFFLLGFLCACILLFLVNWVSKRQSSEVADSSQNLHAMQTVKPTFDPPLDAAETNQEVIWT